MRPENSVLPGESNVADGPSALPALGKPTDGFVSRHFNRKISAIISKRLANTPVTPNQISITTMFVACLASWWMASGEYLWLAIGGLLFQFASILDGCDGEVARLKQMASANGEWVDTVADKVSYLCFYLCVTYGMYRVHNDASLLTIGLIATALYHLVIPFEYTYLRRAESGSAVDFLNAVTEKSPDHDKGRFHRLCSSLSFACRRDFFAAACCCLALLNRLDIIYWLFVVGSVMVVSGVISQAASLRRTLHTTE
jgi:phosphatidylglycerophosphate synthase